MKKILVFAFILFLVIPFLSAQDNEIPFYDFWESLDFREQLFIAIGIQHGLMASYLFFEETIFYTPPGFRPKNLNTDNLDIKNILEYGQNSLSNFIFVQGELMTPLEIALRINTFLDDEKNQESNLSDIIYTIFLNKGEKLLRPQKQE